MRRRFSLLPIGLLFVLTGCLPYSCNRIESRDLLAADSLSRAFAATLPVDTLEVLPAPPLPELSYPRTVAFDQAGTLWVTDTQRHRLVWLNREGESGQIGLDTLRYPYLVGFRGGLPVVFSPEAHRVAAVSSQGITWSATTPSAVPDRVLQYAAVSDSAVWVKLAGEDFAGHLTLLDGDGVEVDSWALGEPYWRWAGALRAVGTDVMSLSGYRPVYYSPGEGGAVDSTVLRGFDSPMLARSNAFLAGNADQPPLLTPAAVPFQGGLLVLNVRPGWLRVEVYDAEGQLTRILVEPSPEFAKEFYPTDLAVYPVENGFELAVAVTQPQPGVRLYRIPAGS